ncbi:MAG: hypothetical protein IPK26_31670 [Planctomycetes bacterium]|nr:hypothetical protein [Planctomycetota bacterium]
MQLPQFWAEARVVGQVNGKPRVLRRFGWSDVDESDALRHAHERAAAAMATWQAGTAVLPRERKLVYGGGDGLPIREQVLARVGHDVVTRNAYGARCLNEPDVLFADLDRGDGLPFLLGPLLALLPLAALLWGVVGAFSTDGACWKALVVLGALGLAIHKIVLIERLRHSAWNSGRLQRRLRQVTKDVLAGLVGVRFAMYETPAGLRLLALHRTFDPTASTTLQLLEELGSDPVYVQMCRLQACFRARISAKPWRIGIHKHMPPRPGVWPVQPSRRAGRDAWIAHYEQVAAGFAACRFVGEFGDAPVHPRAAAVQRMHDELAKARSGLPMA